MRYSLLYIGIFAPLLIFIRSCNLALLLIPTCIAYGLSDSSILGTTVRMISLVSILTFIVAANVVGATSSVGCGKEPTLASGVHSLTVNGKDREYTLKIPENYDAANPYKLIFGFHWANGTMENITIGATTGGVVPGWSYYGLEQRANNTAILVAPNGLNKGWANTDGEDVAFVDAMIDAIETDLCVDQAQRYATGFSYGGSMTRTLACARATVFRAVAVLSGALLSGCDAATDPIPYLGIHGINDPLLPIALGAALRDEFVANNGCTPQDPPAPANGTLTHVKTVFEGCRAEYPVWWIAYDGGHISAPHDGPPRDTDSGDSFAPTETWAFFSQFFE